MTAGDEAASITGTTADFHAVKFVRLRS